MSIVCFQRLESLFNPRLESVLQQRAAANGAVAVAPPAPAASWPATEASAQTAASAVAPASAIPEPAAAEIKSEVKILKGLQGLSPQILAMIKAKEQAKQIKKMTTSSEEQKEVEHMEELIPVNRISLSVSFFSEVNFSSQGKSFLTLLRKILCLIHPRSAYLKFQAELL